MHKDEARQILVFVVRLRCRAYLLGMIEKRRGPDVPLGKASSARDFGSKEKRRNSARRQTTEKEDGEEGRER